MIPGRALSWPSVTLMARSAWGVRGRVSSSLLSRGFEAAAGGWGDILALIVRLPAAPGSIRAAISYNRLPPAGRSPVPGRLPLPVLAAQAAPPDAVQV